MSAHHQKGAIYVGVRNGLLFSYRVKKEEEKLSEILFSLDLRNQFSKEGKFLPFFSKESSPFIFAYL